MILTRALTKSYGSRAVLRGLNLAAEPGAITLLVGTNGAGKTTTLRLLAGLSDPDGGTIAIAGADLQRDRTAALAKLSYLPQTPRFHPRLTVRQVASFYAELRGRPRQAVDQELGAWGLGEYATMPTAQLSGGLRQRLALTVFSLAAAPVLLLDEPGLSLDPEWRDRLQDYLVAQATAGRTVVVTTHLLGEWENRADRCLLIHEGRLGGELPVANLRGAFNGNASSLPTHAELLPICA